MSVQPEDLSAGLVTELRELSDRYGARGVIEAARTVLDPSGRALGLMTDLEHETVNLLGRVAENLSRGIVLGPNRVKDLDELTAYVHKLQWAVMSQAAARAYPDRYRRLGSSIPPAKTCGTDDDK